MTSTDPQAFRPEHFATIQRSVAALPEPERAALVSPGQAAGPVEDLRAQPMHRHRNVLQLAPGGWKALEAVKEVQGDTTNAYFQVTHDGKEVHQSVSLENAQKFYDELH